MKKFKFNKDAFRIAAIVLITIGTLLCVIGFILPPAGEIDGSVLTAFGEMIGANGLLMAWSTIEKAIDKGMDATVKHGETELQISSGDEEKKED